MSEYPILLKASDIRVRFQDAGGRLTVSFDVADADELSWGTVKRLQALVGPHVVFLASDEGSWKLFRTDLVEETKQGLTDLEAGRFVAEECIVEAKAPDGSRLSVSDTATTGQVSAIKAGPALKPKRRSPAPPKASAERYLLRIVQGETPPPEGDPPWHIERNAFYTLCGTATTPGEDTQILRFSFTDAQSLSLVLCRECIEASKRLPATGPTGISMAPSWSITDSMQVRTDPVAAVS